MTYTKFSDDEKKDDRTAARVLLELARRLDEGVLTADEQFWIGYASSRLVCR